MAGNYWKCLFNVLIWLKRAIIVQKWLEIDGDDLKIATSGRSCENWLYQNISCGGSQSNVDFCSCCTALRNAWEIEQLGDSVPKLACAADQAATRSHLTHSILERQCFEYIYRKDH